jgi:hypothetical protein
MHEEKKDIEKKQFKARTRPLRPVTVLLRPQTNEDKRIRMKYLRKLTKEGVWLAPMKQPKSS